MTPYPADVAHARRTLRRTFVYACGVALIYFAGAWLSLQAAAPFEIAFIWPPAGILLAALVLQPRSAWPLTLGATAVAACAANLLIGNPLAVSLAFTGANLIESFLAAAVLLRVLQGPPHMSRLRDVLWLACGAALLMNGLTALIGASVSAIGFDTAFWEAWRTWWLADGLGMLLIGGAAFAWRTPPTAALRLTPLRQQVELFLLIGVGLAVGAFVAWAPSILPIFQSPYLLFPLLFWAGARFGPRGAATGSLLLAGLLLAATLAGHGSFAQIGLAPRERMLELQLFLLVLTFSAMTLAALIAERAAAQAAVARTLDAREAEVAARTADLEAANRRLIDEAAERSFQAQLLDSVQQAVIATDLEGRITYWNRYAEALYGWSAADVIGRSIVDVTPSAATQEQAAALMANLQVGMSWSGDFEVRRRDGTTFPALVTDSPVVNATGQMIGIVGVSIDISAQRAAERALHEAQAELEMRVAARTQELAATNDRLQAELAERMRAETMLAAHLHAQEALAQSAQILLQPTIAAQRSAVIDQALTALRSGVRCSHAFLLQLHAAPDGAASVSIAGFSLRPDVAAPNDADGDRKMCSFALSPACSARLSTGKPQTGAVADLFDAETPFRTMLHQWGVQTLTLCPVQSLEQQWGVLGFAEQRNQRNWSDYEQLLLRTAADLLRQVLQRWQAEDALADSERRFRAIFNSQFQFIGLLEPDGTVLEANSTALAFGGISPVEVIGRPFWEAHWWAAMGEATQAQLREAIRAAADGTFVRYEVDVCGSGNQIETIDFSLKPLHDAHGAVVLLIPEGRIVSAQKRAALALSRSEQRYRSLVAAAPVGIFETDAAGACVFVNERWCAIAGIPLADALGAGWIASLHPDDRAEGFADWSAFVAGRRGYHRELRYRHPNGAVRWTIADAVALRDEHGQVIGHLGTVTDMTEQKQAELLLSASLAEKEVLLREIHHRVKNNLQVVSSLLRLQRRRVADPHIAAALSESEQRVAVMVLVHQLLYQSAGIAALDAHTYLEQLSGQLLQLYDAGAHAVRITVTGDEQRLSLEQAIPCGLLVHELLTNSLKYAFPQQSAGIITIDLRLIAPEVVQLQVADNGIGLPHPPPPGASLGMRLIDGFVRQLRGSITWSSGPGTLVTIQFPVGVSPVPMEHPLPERPQP